MNEDTDYSTVSNRPGNTNMDDATVNEIFEDFDRTVCARTTLQPLDISFVSNRSMNKCKETLLTLLMKPKISVKLKNYVDCRQLKHRIKPQTPCEVFLFLLYLKLLSAAHL